MRRHSPERVGVWRDVLDAWERSGQTVNAFCGDRKLTRSNFDRRRRIPAAGPAKSKPSSFGPLRVAAGPMAEVVRPSGILVRPPCPHPPMPSSATPKRLFGQAVGYTRNQWPSSVRYLDDARFAIDNGAAERAIRPIAIGRANWLRIGGDGGLVTASVRLSVCASARRNRVDPWAYLSSVLPEVSVRAPRADAADLLPDQSAKAHGGPKTPPPPGRRSQ